MGVKYAFQDRHKVRNIIKSLKPCPFLSADDISFFVPEPGSCKTILCVGNPFFGKKFVSQYLPDFNAPGAVKTGEVEMLAAVALKNSRAGALRITPITFFFCKVSQMLAAVALKNSRAGAVLRNIKIK